MVARKKALKCFLVLCLGVWVVFVGLVPAIDAQQKVKYTGTFTSLEFNQEGGDLLGEEIHIVLTQKGYQGALQISEGEPSQIILVQVVFDQSNSVRFEIPSSSPSYGGGVFDGKIDSLGIKGVLRLKGGVENLIKWKRGRSYWDK